MKEYSSIYEWLLHNREWFFSGIGISVISIIFEIVRQKIFKRKKLQNTLTNSFYDDSMFISENPPDGIIIPVGKKFKKSWTVKNNGNIIWKNRTLRCTEYAKNCFYPVNDKIKIPQTLPGEIIILRVEYYVEVEGDYSSKWKIFDENNNMIYPNKSVGLGVNIMARNNYK